MQLFKILLILLGFIILTISGCASGGGSGSNSGGDVGSGGGQVSATDVYLKLGGTRKSGKSVSGDWSNANCYGDLRSAMSAMSSGDTLTIDDGTYSGTTNTINGDNRPPSGTAGSFTTIRARNIPCQGGYSCSSPLKVYLPTGLYAQSGGTAGTYIKFWGLRFSDANTYTGWNDLYFKQCAFMGDSIGNSAAFGLGGVHNLLEDCVFYGMGRYKLVMYDYTGTGPTSNNLCRRCVSRQDFANGGCTTGDCASNPIASLTSYGNVGDAFLNCIDVDSNLPAYWGAAAGEYDGAFYAPKHIGGNMLVQGSIVINNAAGVGSSTGSTGVTYTDVVGVNVGGGMYHKGGANINRFTLINADTGNFTYLSGQLVNTLPTDAGVGGYEGEAVATNSLFRSLVTPTAFYGIASGDYINTYSVTKMGVTPTHQITTDPFSNGLLYPVRVENGSALAIAGSSGGQVGARIVNKLGKDGTFKGDTDWNTEQGSLWPFPLEDWIKAEMASMPATINGSAMPSATRGFASPTAKQLNGTSVVTLTSYIWESLGNPIPTSLYSTATLP